MKPIYLILLISSILIECKDKQMDPDPEINGIVGKWRFEGYEKEENGNKIWFKETTDQPSFLTIRFDGIMLNSNGLPACCRPGSYNLNGTFYKIEPKADIPENPQCALVDCVGCETLQLDQTGDEMIMTYCEPLGTRIKYVRD